MKQIPAVIADFRFILSMILYSSIYRLLPTKDMDCGADGWAIEKKQKCELTRALLFARLKISLSLMFSWRAGLSRSFVGVLFSSQRITENILPLLRT